MKKQFYGSAPLFRVNHIQRAVDYYVEVLGFERPHLWGEPPFFAMPKREGIIVMLQEHQDGTRTNEGVWDAYFWVADAGSLFKKFKNNGARIHYPPEHKEAYGCYEFAIKDPDNYILAFGQETDKNPFFEVEND